MEVKDISNRKMGTLLIEIDHAATSVSGKVQNEMMADFLKGIPFSYLLGRAEFYHHEYFINHNVLIPRQETEYLVDLIIQEQKKKAKRILDVGTGSGVILLSLLAHGVGQTGLGVDISDEALKVSEINSRRLGLVKKAKLLKSDRLDKVEGHFDLIVSNPPYIKASSHKNLVHPNVDTYEPHEALYLPDDYYGFWFEDFFAEIRSHLKGTFYMEGHELEVDGQALMLQRLGFENVQVLTDLTGMKRFLRASYS
jgi:release factor glutamine methyltransferase